jgi:hypothetical protein
MVVNIIGEFVDGKWQGKAKLVLVNGIEMEVTFKNGKIIKE